MPLNQPETVAAVDLGSNSFHMIIAGLRKGELIVVDRLREMVRLGAGLTPDRQLTVAAQQLAIDCLYRFGQRLKGMPPETVRAVGTNTLRAARNAPQFLQLAEQALGFPIEIISGIEEARLIYQGVAKSLASDGRRRLVMDIGGGSTEYIIGIDGEPLDKESLRMGSVSMSLEYFPDGKISPKRFKKAVLAAQMELEPVEKTFRSGNWDQVVGASGTLRSVQKVLLGSGWGRDHISLEGLNQLIAAMLAAGHQNRLRFPNLSPDRRVILPGGLAILYATFKSLGIETMEVSDGALREGLLYDILGRINNEDIRARTVTALAERFHVDKEHADQVRTTAYRLAQQVLPRNGVDSEVALQWLAWAIELHEIGLDIAHSQYHKHGAYIIQNADLPGFSRQNQLLLATIVRMHRRKFQIKLLKELAAPWDEAVIPLIFLLRLSIVLNRSRRCTSLPDIAVKIELNQIHLRFPEQWLNEHPLTVADLELEAGFLKDAGIVLNYA